MLFFACFFPLLLLVVAAISVFVLTTQFLNSPQKFKFETWAGFLKALCEMPLGLGAVALFGQLSPFTQSQHLGWFTVYVNCAVIGNIAMMMFVPSGGTLRGQSSRLTCIMLLVWLVREMSAHNWQTVRYEHDSVFVFLSSPMAWCLCHAAYRVAMMSLPIFESLRYVSMEALSLASMMCLYWRFGDSQTPISNFFGYADTLTIASLAMVSKCADTAGVKLSLRRTRELETRLDTLFVSVHMIVFVWGVRVLAFS